MFVYQLVQIYTDNCTYTSEVIRATSKNKDQLDDICKNLNKEFGTDYEDFVVREIVVTESLSKSDIAQIYQLVKDCS